LPGPDVLRSSPEAVAYVGLNPRRHQSGTSIDRVTRISKIGNAVLRAALYMPAMSAMRYNPAIVALLTRLKFRGRLKPKQIVVAAMRKLLVLCFGVLKTGKPFNPAITMAVEPHQGVDRMEGLGWWAETGSSPGSPKGRVAARGLDAERRLTEKRLGPISPAIDNDHGIYRDEGASKSWCSPTGERPVRVRSSKPPGSKCCVSRR
jgi:hypothetical protein